MNTLNKERIKRTTNERQTNYENKPTTNTNELQTNKLDLFAVTRDQAWIFLETSRKKVLNSNRLKQRTTKNQNEERTHKKEALVEKHAFVATKLQFFCIFLSRFFAHHGKDV
jgi:hypothetical protein